MAVNFVNLGRVITQFGNERFFAFLSCGGDAFSMLRRSGVWAFHLLLGMLGKFIRYQCQLGQYQHNK